jgi:tetratricopeptide (TPR) repeat protein
MYKKFLALSLCLVATNSWPTSQAKLSSRPEAAQLSLLSHPYGRRKLLKGKIDRQVAFADSLMLKGKYAEAENLYKESLSRNKNNIAARTGLGMALAKQFKLDGAAEQFDQVLAKDPNNAQALAGKALVDFNRLQSSSNTIIKNKDSILQSAEASLKQALASDPHMPEAHYTLGMVYKEQGKLNDSISEFKEATKLDPHYSEAFSGLGLAQLANGDTAGALQSFKQAIAINSGNSTAHYGLGRAYLAQGQTDDAIKELNTSLAQFPNSAPTHLAMGEAYQTQGNTVAAVREYQESIRIKPENFDAYSHIADIREARGDIEHSIAELRSALELMPGNPSLHQRIADESLRVDKLDDAIKEYRNVLAVSPGNNQAAQGLTRALYLKANKDASGAFFTSNEYQSASALIDQAVAMNPNDMQLRLAQAKIRAMSGATVDLSQIGVPQNDGERVAYAEALLAQNKFSDASNQMNIVINNTRDGKEACAVADLALMIKDLPDAEVAYRRALNMPGTTQRAQYGLDAVAKAKDTAKQDYDLASDLAHHNQLTSAIDKYHSSIYQNPTAPAPRLGLAEALEKYSPKTSANLKQAITHYQAYESLSPNMLPKEKEKIDKRIVSLQSKAAKLAEKGK